MCVPVSASGSLRTGLARRVVGQNCLDFPAPCQCVVSAGLGHTRKVAVPLPAQQLLLVLKTEVWYRSSIHIPELTTQGCAHQGGATLVQKQELLPVTCLRNPCFSPDICNRSLVSSPKLLLRAERNRVRRSQQPKHNVPIRTGGTALVDGFGTQQQTKVGQELLPPPAECSTGLSPTKTQWVIEGKASF